MLWGDVCPELSQGTKIRKFFESGSKTLKEMIDFETNRKRAGPEGQKA